MFSMLRKAKSESRRLQPVGASMASPTRRSFPDGGTSPQLGADTLIAEAPQRKKSSEKRKVSRVHLGRLQFLPEHCLDDDVSKI